MSHTPRRRTTSYLLTVYTTDKHYAADQMIERCPRVVEASGVGVDLAFIRFRAEDDDTARRIAAMCWDGPAELSHGHAVNKVVV